MNKAAVALLLPTLACAAAVPAVRAPEPPAAAEQPALPLVRLTRGEYELVIRDLVGVSGVADGTPLPGDPTGSSGFSTPGLMSEVDFSAFRDAAEEVARRLNVAGVLPSCAARDEACVRAFVAAFAGRAFRRPPSPRELAALRTWHDEVLATEPFDQRVRALTAAILQMPSFLYHWELDRGQGPYAAASRLSFFLWSTLPDEALLTAAASGQLATREGVARQARRMLASEKLADTWRIFLREWLGLGDVTALKKSDKTFPKAVFDHHRGPRWMARELELFSRAVVVEGDGKLTTLLTAPWTYVNEPLAALYGVSVPPDLGEAFVKVELDPGQRPGLLTRTGFLAVMANAYEGDPVKRGMVVRERLLCQRLAPPPADVPPLPAPAPGLGVRERHEDHVLDVGCASCHRLTDGIGFGFSTYDALGRFVTTENDEPIDSTGEVVNIDGADRRFETPAELVAILASSEELRRCHARQWLRFALRRELAPADERTLESVHAAFAAADYDIRELLVAIASEISP